MEKHDDSAKRVSDEYDRLADVAARRLSLDESSSAASDEETHTDDDKSAQYLHDLQNKSKDTSEDEKANWSSFDMGRDLLLKSQDCLCPVQAWEVMGSSMLEAPFSHDSFVKAHEPARFDDITR